VFIKNCIILCMSWYDDSISKCSDDWNSLLALTNTGQDGKEREVIFQTVTKGFDIDRSDWQYKLPKASLNSKIRDFDAPGSKPKAVVDHDLDTEHSSKGSLEMESKQDNLSVALYRPFCKVYFHRDKGLDVDTYEALRTYSEKNSNKYLALHLPSNSKDFFCLSTNLLCNVHLTGSSTHCIPLYRYTNGEIRQSNITDWALQIFNDHYRQNEPSSPVCYAGSRELREEFLLDIPAANTITKEDIFHYVYAVLHYPAYRKQYELNLKQGLPRIPLYNNFQQWVAWGKRLMDLHINYETVTPYPFERRDVVMEVQTGISLNSSSNAKLIAIKEDGVIEIDAVTSLSGIPAMAWEYQPGYRSALEWVLSQYREWKPSDPLIANKLNNYRFNDHKEAVIDLLGRVCTVSRETIKIVGMMEG